MAPLIFYLYDIYKNSTIRPNETLNAAKAIDKGLFFLMVNLDSFVSVFKL